MPFLLEYFIVHIGINKEKNQKIQYLQVLALEDNYCLLINTFSLSFILFFYLAAMPNV